MNTDDHNPNLFTAGWALVWRRQRLLWWVFIVNLLLGLISVHTPAHTLQQTISHTLAGEPLVHRFDLGMFYELLDRPEVNLLSSHGDVLASGLLFFVFMLFVSGGILSAYRMDRKLTSGELFAASGAFFWRFVRLMLLSLIALIVLGWLSSGVVELSHDVDERAIADQSSFYVLVVGGVVVALLGLWVRLWFDLTQVRAVAEDERGMLANVADCWHVALRSSAKLFPAYLAIGLVALVIMGLGFLVWTRIPAAAIPATFILLEFMVLVQITVRLWQRACTTLWYKHDAVVLMPVTEAYIAISEPSAEEDSSPGTETV